MNTNIAHPWEMHCHSQASDGVLPPQALYDRAKDAGLSHLVLTDHDTAAGYRALRADGELSDELRLWPGAELSSLWLGRNIHIVGIGMDVYSDAWLAVEQRYVKAREQRFERMMFVLQRAGLNIDEDAIRIEAAGALPGRPHVARYLVSSGQAKDSAQAFKRWLGTGKVGDVKQGWPPLEQAIADIRDSGGKAVLAHPHRYKLTWRKLDQLLEDFQQAGGEAVEVCCPAMPPQMRDRLVNSCCERNLLIGGGSDFHQPDTPWARLGWYPQWPSQGKRLVDALLA